MLRSDEIEQLSLAARRAARAREWPMARRAARRILQLDGNSAEGHFLHGQACKATGAFENAEKSFRRSLQIDSNRYDAAVELAELYVRQHRNQEAVELLRLNEGLLANSPVYLEMAASAYSRMDIHEAALPLLQRACELQPEIERFRTGLATCRANLGEVAEAIRIYEELVQHHPDHQRFHHELAQLRTASDYSHVSQMKAVLESASLPPERNIFLYYAIGKELEDLGVWDEAFACYEKAGNAVKSVAGYDVGADIELVDALIETCSASWVREAATPLASTCDTSVPIFIVGLPRSGTTLAERMVASHTQVRSIGETFFLPIALCRQSGAVSATQPSAAEIRALGAADMDRLARLYLEFVRYKLGDEPYFIEKLPENFLYLGFVATAFPNARIVHLQRHPMDVCFAMYKQPYFRFAYSLDDVGRFYVAYARLMEHWRSLLGVRIIDVQYEDLVVDPEHQVRRLLEHLGLGFQAACLAPEENDASSRTASRIQIREGIHRRSVGRWKRFERHLAGLREYLTLHGVEL
jgi:tetratricopeptide (TPR) repeat protein